MEEKKIESKSEETSSEVSPLKNDGKATLLSKVNKDLIVPKLSFFFFFMGIGAFLPYLGVYYKQLWLNARETGILLGIRPFIKMLFSPVWGIITDYCRKPKTILLLSIFGSLIAHWSQSIVSPFDLPCYPENTSSAIEGKGEPISGIAKSLDIGINTLKDQQFKREVSRFPLGYESITAGESIARSFGEKKLAQKYQKLEKRSTNRKNTESENPMGRKDINFHIADKPQRPNNQRESNLVYSDKDFGELFETFEQPEKSTDEREQMKEESVEPPESGSITGYIESLPRTIMIKNKKIKSPKPKTDFRIRDNKKIFIILLVLIIFGEMVAAPAPMLTDSGTLALLSGREHEYGKQRLFGSLGWGTGALVAGAVVTAFHYCPYSDNINYVPIFYVFALAMMIDLCVSAFFKFGSEDSEKDVEVKGCVQGLMLFGNVKNTAFIFVLFFCGLSHSLKLSFLFWFLQDIGGTPVLFTLIVLINSLSEVLMFFVATYIVKRIGHDAVLYSGLWCYGIKFLLYSYIKNPWHVLPLECFQGVTYGLVWTASVSYVVAGPGYGATIQGIIHGVYWGLGMAVGGVLGGFLVHVLGARATFRITAGCSLVILILFFALNSFYRRGDDYMALSTEPDEKAKEELEKCK